MAGAVVAIVLASGCASPDRPDASDDELEAFAAAPVHVTFSGGGWRAHTAHSAWTMALLQATPQRGARTLDQLFSNVETISSNSGGSWFSTMLMYSNAFATDIAAPTALSTWATSGWLGKQKTHFESLLHCYPFTGVEFDACVFEHYSAQGALYWHSVVEGLVYRDYPISTTLSGPRVSWARDKTLLIAGSMLTTEAVLNESRGDTLFYQACPSPLSPSVQRQGSRYGAACSGAVADVAPVTFTSLPSGSSAMPPFFPTSAAGASPTFNVLYSQATASQPTTATATIQNPVAVDQVPVVTAAAASSAAAGFGASASVLRRARYSAPWSDAYDASDEALGFSLSGSRATFVPGTSLSGRDVAALSRDQIVRIADGGPVDNSGVAQLVARLQRTAPGARFHIVAFDDTQQATSYGSGPRVGANVAYLFGQGLSPGNQFCSGAHGGGICVQSPTLQIFDAAPLTSPTPYTWIESTADGAIIFTRYLVVTTSNPTFGIAAGTGGLLDVVTTAWTKADTAPTNAVRDGDFVAYTNMIRFVDIASQRGSSTGAESIRDRVGSALGVGP